MDSYPQPHGRQGTGTGASTTPSHAELWSALDAANIPTLLMVLAQLTGDPRWLAPPYAPSRTQGMDDNNSGGLPEEIQEVIRLAAYEVLTGGPAPGADQIPSPELFAAMVTTCMGEDVPVEYAEMMLEEMGLHSRHPDWTTAPDPVRLARFQVAVIGAGVSGICAAIELRRAGIACTVFERSAKVGGTWFENTYPGCGVDTPSHLYSFSFAPHNWSRYFAQQQEIHDYLENCVDTFGVRGDIRLQTEVRSAEFDESARRWSIAARNPDGTITVESFNAVISAVGQLNQPAWPTIDGVERFAGTIVHSARWPADLDVAGRRLAVIGSGATAMQIVPTVADTAAHVAVFQRSPHWAAPSTNYKLDVPAGVRYLIDNVPLYAAWYRCRLVWSYSDKVHSSLQVDPTWHGGTRSINAANDGHRRYFTRHITDQLGERTDLIPSVLPDYPPFAKRMLIDNDWFHTLASKPNVELVRRGIAEITAAGIVDDEGERHLADVIVYATGFDTLRMIGSYDVIGRAGKSLRSEWGDDDARAYLGITMPGFPNFFCLYGPNTGLGHGGSLIFLTECATRYITEILQCMILDEIDTVEVKEAVFDEYNRQVDEAHEHMVWTHAGTHNWYRNSRGRVVTNSPWRVVDYWRMTHEPDLNEFEVEHPLDDADRVTDVAS